MKIEKDITNVGWWLASCWIGGTYFVGASMNKLEAIDRLFAKLEWAEVGNWNRPKKSFFKRLTIRHD